MFSSPLPQVHMLKPNAQGGGVSISNTYDGVEFSAARYNSIYGASTTVQPPSLTMRYYIKY